MRNTLISVALFLIVSGTAAPIYAQGSLINDPGKGANAQELARKALAGLPLVFEANRGQADSQGEFLSRGGGYSLFLTRSEAVLALQADRPSENSTSTASTAFVHMKLVGGNQSPKVEGVDKIPGASNYFSGSDPARWRTKISNYAKVKYEGVYPGVDLLYYGNRGSLEYDFVVAPGADPKRIQIQIDSTEPGPARPLRIDANGSLVVSTGKGEVRFDKPLVYQPGAVKRSVDARYVLQSPNQVAFAVADYDRSKPLVIDPVIVYSTFIGGGSVWGRHFADDVAVYTDPMSGHTYAYIIGATTSVDWISHASNFGPGVLFQQPGSYPLCCGPETSYAAFDAFVIKVDPAQVGPQSLVWAAFLGGSLSTAARGIAIDQGGNAYVVGSTTSTNFPIASAYQTAPRGGHNAFLSKISANGSSLLYSTYFGGSGFGSYEGETGNSVALDSTGRAYFVGETRSADLPTLNAFQSTLRGTRASFLAVVDTTLSGPSSLVYSTYLGGTSAGFPFGRCERPLSVAVDGAGSVHLAGNTSTPDFPIVNGFQTALLPGSGGAGFYAKLNPFAQPWSQLVYSTYLGADACGSYGVTATLAVDSGGRAYLTGSGNGIVPTAGALSGGGVFVMKIDPSRVGANSVVYSASLPVTDPSSGWMGRHIAVDSSGSAFVIGSTEDMGLPNASRSIPNGVGQSFDGGRTWTVGEGITQFPVTTIAIDARTTPRTLYAGASGGPGGLFKSVDGGLHWSLSNSGLAQQQIEVLAVDPANSANIYAGTSSDTVGGIFKSTDHGATWSAFDDGLHSTAMRVRSLVFDGSTLYAGAGDGLYKLLPASTTWVSLGRSTDVHSIAIDSTTTPHTIYIASEAGDNSAYRSTDGGLSWTNIQAANSGPLFPIVIDPTAEPKLLYALDYYCFGDGNGLLVSSDRGDTWTPRYGPDACQGSIAVDNAVSPAAVYVTGAASVYKSVDHFATWERSHTGYTRSLTVDQSTGTAPASSTIYVGSAQPLRAAFLAQLNSAGSAILFSTYLGGFGGATSGLSLALDAANNIYAVGLTESVGFPSVNGFQPTYSYAFVDDNNGFFVKIGTQVLPVTSERVSEQVAVQTGTLSISFPNILGSTGGGSPTLNVTPVSPGTAESLSLSNNLGAYEISTTAIYNATVSQPITLCFQVQAVNDQTVFNNLSLLHIVNATPVDVTSSRDFATRTLCGSVTSLSPFVVVKGASDQLNDLIRTINEFDLNHGIQTSLDAKLQSAIAALASAKKNDTKTACNNVNAFINAVSSNSALTTAQSATFTSAANQVRATLGCAR
ncbi:MAG: SBBP repeat-containing protein [Acidobacteriota bacterium]